MWDKIFSVVIIIASWFILPIAALNVYHRPENYWAWFGLVIWIYVMVSETVIIYSAKGTSK